MSERSVLIVDDEPDIRDGLRDILEPEGYRVHLARNGSAALELLPSVSRPLVILLDMLMPVMDGAGFFEALARTPFADVPVIVCTSDPTRAPADRPLLRKPFNIDRLLAVLDSAFNALVH